MTDSVKYRKNSSYTVEDQNGDSRTGVYVGQEHGAGGLVFDIFQTRETIPNTPGFVQVWMPAAKKVQP